MVTIVVMVMIMDIIYKGQGGCTSQWSRGGGQQGPCTQQTLLDEYRLLLNLWEEFDSCYSQ